MIPSCTTSLALALTATLSVVGPFRPVAAQELTLSEAAASTLRAHPSVMAVRARVDGAEDEVTVVRAQRLPGLELEGDLTHFEEPMIVAPLHSFDRTTAPRFDETLVQGRLAMAYTVYDGGARSDRIDGAEAMLRGTRQARRATEMELLQLVAGAYVDLVTARAVYDAAAARTDALGEELDRAQRQVDAGTAPRVQLLRASASLQDARAEREGAASRVGLAERNLARIMGVDPSTVEGRPLAGLQLRDPEESSGPSETSPAVEGAEQRVRAAEARLSAERAGRLPRLDAGAALLDFGTLTGEHVLEWQAGLQLSWPLFTGGARSASVRAAEAGLREARAELAAAELEVSASEDAARSAVTEADARIEALEAAVAQWAEVARIEALALDAGSGVQSDLLRAQAGLFQARAHLAAARSNAVGARVGLARARGLLEMSWINEALENRR